MSTSNAKTAAVAAAVLLMVEGISLIVPRGQPHADGFMRRWSLGEIVGATEVTQTFTPQSNGFHAFSFAAAPFRAASSPSVRVLLQDIHTSEVITVLERHVTVRDLVGGEWHRVEFPEVSNSAGRTYSLTLSVPEAGPGEGIVVEALKGDYDRGQLTFNGVKRWGSLRFTTEMTRATYLTRLGDHRARLGAGGLRIAVVVSGWALFQFLALYALLTVVSPANERRTAVPHNVSPQRDGLAAPPAAVR